jgi:hypothetical protein
MSGKVVRTGIIREFGFEPVESFRKLTWHMLRNGLQSCFRTLAGQIDQPPSRAVLRSAHDGRVFDNLSLSPAMGSLFRDGHSQLVAPIGTIYVRWQPHKKPKQTRSGNTVSLEFKVFLGFQPGCISTVYPTKPNNFNESEQNEQHERIHCFRPDHARDQ